MKAPPGDTRRGLHIGIISDAFIGILSAGQQADRWRYGRAIPVGAVRDGDAAATGLIGLSWPPIGKSG